MHTCISQEHLLSSHFKSDRIPLSIVVCTRDRLGWISTQRDQFDANSHEKSKANPTGILKSIRSTTFKQGNGSPFMTKSGFLTVIGEREWKSFARRNICSFSCNEKSFEKTSKKIKYCCYHQRRILWWHQYKKPCLHEQVSPLKPSRNFRMSDQTIMSGQMDRSRELMDRLILIGWRVQPLQRWWSQTAILDVMKRNGRYNHSVGLHLVLLRLASLDGGVESMEWKNLDCCWRNRSDRMAKRVELHLPKQSENILVVGGALVVGTLPRDCRRADGRIIRRRMWSW